LRFRFHHLGVEKKKEIERATIYIKLKRSFSTLLLLLY
jgi:hypothetical protein